MVGPLVELVPGEVVVELPGAEDHPGGGRVAVARVVDGVLEPTVGELLEPGGRLLHPQERLRRHHDERPPGSCERLPPERMEVLRRGAQVEHRDVVLRRELEEPLEAGARVLRPGALVAVREQQGQVRRLPPLREPGHDELVDDHLGDVHEVAVLRLPEHERLGRRRGVAVLEPECGCLRERRVLHLERRVRAGQVLDRRVGRAGLGVVEDQMALGERAALAVLPGQPDRDRLRQQAREGERLGMAPLDGAVVDGGDAAL